MSMFMNTENPAASQQSPGEQPKSPQRIILQSDGDTVVLKQLILADAGKYFDLVNANRAHLSQFGGGTAKIYKTFEDVQKSIEHPGDPHIYRFGIWDGEVMVGSDTLTPVENNRAALGSWIAKEATGKNYAARARKLLVAFAFEQLQLDSVFCDIFVGNEASRKSVERSGFEFIGQYDGMWRYELTRPAPMIIKQKRGPRPI